MSIWFDLQNSCIKCHIQPWAACACNSTGVTETGGCLGFLPSHLSLLVSSRSVTESVSKRKVDGVQGATPEHVFQSPPHVDLHTCDVHATYAHIRNRVIVLNQGLYPLRGCLATSGDIWLTQSFSSRNNLRNSCNQAEVRRPCLTISAHPCARGTGAVLVHGDGEWRMATVDSCFPGPLHCPSQCMQHSQELFPVCWADTQAFSFPFLWLP